MNKARPAEGGGTYVLKQKKSSLSSWVDDIHLSGGVQGACNKIFMA